MWNCYTPLQLRMLEVLVTPANIDEFPVLLLETSNNIATFKLTSKARLPFRNIIHTLHITFHSDCAERDNRLRTPLNIDALRNFLGFEVVVVGSV